MSNVDDVFNKIMAMPIKNLLVLCATAIETEMKEKQIDALLMALEVKLQKRRIEKNLEGEK